MNLDASINGPNPAGGYVPKVGDKVRRPEWDRGEWVQILATDGPDVWIRRPDGFRETFYDVADWEPYVEPVVYPERWINVYGLGTGAVGATRSHADFAHDNGERAFPELPRLGVLHLRPDGTTEMEAP